MVKKVFLNREKAIPTAHAPSVSRENTASTRRNRLITEQLHFMILHETAQSFPKCKTTGRSLLSKFRAPAQEE